MTGPCAAGAEAPVVRSTSYLERFFSPGSGWRIERALDPRCGEDDGGLVGVAVGFRELGRAAWCGAKDRSWGKGGLDSRCDGKDGGG